MSKANSIELPDKDNLVVFKNEKYPVLNDCRLGRYRHITILSMRSTTH